MKPRYAFALSFVALLTAAGSASADYCINKDIIKIGGPTAYDVAVEITGTQSLIWQYDGDASKGTLFKTFTNTPNGTNEVLHWSNLMGGNLPVSSSVTYHVGWCTKQPSKTAKMYWTDRFGRPIPGRVCQTNSHTWTSSGLGVQWDNAMGVAMNVTNVSFALSSTPWNLADLNRDNRELADRLQPLPEGDSIPLEPDAIALRQVPGAVAGDWVVLVYEVACPTSQAVVRDFVQFQF
jgi:hypothetical protein